MSETIKDSAIKLFGKTITLNLLPDDSVSQQTHTSLPTSTSQHIKEASMTRSRQESSIINPRDEETWEVTSPPSKEEKRPEKMLPCPRCNSMDTKFCYFNNYNVNQPRYFCKKCQRYWTSGGTMRSVPVGSGRRKNKTTVGPDFMQSAFLIGPPNYPWYWVPTCTLGKHSRGEDSEAKRSTLRIGDPNEAAIWSTWDKSGVVGGGGKGIFKGKVGRSVDNATTVRRANPAAFSRSINFHETA